MIPSRQVSCLGGRFLEPRCLRSSLSEHSTRQFKADAIADSNPIAGTLDLSYTVNMFKKGLP
jgi:hypothetical protein